MSTDAKQVYEKLRQEALVEGKKIDCKQASTIVVDFPAGDGIIVTFVLQRNGSASIYMSSGEGFMGCGRHQEVKMATKEIFQAYDVLETKHLETEEGKKKFTFL